MNPDVSPLTLFRWWRPHPDEPGPEWIESDAAEWEVEASLFPTLLKSEKRWMSWEILPPLTRSPTAPWTSARNCGGRSFELPEGEDAYLRFANRYGPLTRGLVVVRGDPEASRFLQLAMVARPQNAPLSVARV